MKKNRKKHNRKWNKKRISLFLLILIFSIYLLITSHFPVIKDSLNVVMYHDFDSSDYDIIKQDINLHYSGIGQEKVNDKDGYFTTFTTKQKTYKEYKQNGNSSWSNNSYWDNTMATDGCGITAISIILSGYDKEYTPENLRKKYYPVLHGDKISNELNKTFGISNSDFFYDEFHLSNTYIEEHLNTDRPILICVWNKPTHNRWTTASHYMVLLASDNNGMVYVSNPNGLEHNSKSSGWYPINEVTPYIAKALYIETY